MVKQRHSNPAKAKKYTKIVNIPEGFKFIDLDLRSLSIKIKQDKFFGKTFDEPVDMPGNLFVINMKYRQDQNDVLVKYVKKDDLTTSALSKLYA